MVYSCFIKTNYYPSTGSGWPNLISKFSSLGNRWSAISSFRSLEHSFIWRWTWSIRRPLRAAFRIKQTTEKVWHVNRRLFFKWSIFLFLFFFNYCLESIEKESNAIYFKTGLMLFTNGKSLIQWLSNFLCFFFQIIRNIHVCLSVFVYNCAIKSAVS